MYYNTLGTLVGITVGLIVSYFTGPQDLSQLNPNLCVPQIRKYFPEKPLQNSTTTNLEEKTNHIKNENVVSVDTKL